MCTDPTGTFDSFTCTLPGEGDILSLEVGSYDTKIIITSHAHYGLIVPQSSIDQVMIPLAASSVSPASSTNNGGMEAVIQGTGFSDMTTV